MGLIAYDFSIKKNINNLLMYKTKKTKISKTFLIVTWRKFFKPTDKKPKYFNSQLN